MARARWHIGPRSLRIVCPNLSKKEAGSLSEALGLAMHSNGIDTPAKAEMFIAQCAHESMGFTVATEFASGSAYDGRKDLGNTKPGDGKRFKGRGFIQITGRTNYYEVSKALKKNFMKDPALLAKPPWASLSAAWWWRAHGCNALCDGAHSLNDRLLAVTKRINGGFNGIDSRRKYLRKARLVRRWLVPRNS